MTTPQSSRSSSEAGLAIRRETVTAEFVRLSVSGEVDAGTAASLADALTTLLNGRPLSRIEVDLADVRFLDSSGIRVLLDAHVLGEQRDCRITVARPQPVVRRVLDITGVLAVLGVTV